MYLKQISLQIYENKSEYIYIYIFSIYVSKLGYLVGLASPKNNKQFFRLIRNIKIKEGKERLTKKWLQLVYNF